MLASSVFPSKETQCFIAVNAALMCLGSRPPRETASSSWRRVKAPEPVVVMPHVLRHIDRPWSRVRHLGSRVRAGRNSKLSPAVSNLVVLFCHHTTTTGVTGNSYKYDSTGEWRGSEYNGCVQMSWMCEGEGRKMQSVVAWSG